MNYLLDSNVVSEWVKPRPDPGVASWLADVDEDRVFLSVVTLAELRHGVERMPDGRRRDQVDVWLSHDLPLRFEGRVLSVDDRVADAWVGWWLSAKRSAGPLSPWTRSSRQRSGSTT